MKNDIIRAMMNDSKSTHMSRASAAAALDTVARAIRKVAETEGRARVPGLGNFRIVDHDTRTIRNPRTGITTKIMARSVLKFREVKKGSR